MKLLVVVGPKHFATAQVDGCCPVVDAILDSFPRSMAVDREPLEDDESIWVQTQQGSQGRGWFRFLRGQWTDVDDAVLPRDGVAG